MRARQLSRLIQINHVLAKHRLDDLIKAIHLLRPLRFIAYLSPQRWRKSESNLPRGERIRLALQDLGPIFVKLGQVLSTRRDLLPPDISQSLAKLQDQVAPFSTQQAREMIDKAFEDDAISELFEHIEKEPLASASIAQVHAARLSTGDEVVIKLVRPGLKPVIKRDIDLLYTLASFAERYWSEGKRLRPREIVAELEKNLYDELDMLREASSASQLQRNFEGTDLLYVPKIYWNLTKPNLLVQERIYGMPIGDTEGLIASGVNMGRLAEIG
ncbi:hypothetical protein LCGC14_1274270, partial [marine sediment metagenome]